METLMFSVIQHAVKTALLSGACLTQRIGSDNSQTGDTIQRDVVVPVFPSTVLLRLASSVFSRRLYNVFSKFLRREHKPQRNDFHSRYNLFPPTSAPGVKMASYRSEKSYVGDEKIVIAFDIGTTMSQSSTCSKTPCLTRMSGAASYAFLASGSHPTVEMVSSNEYDSLIS